MKITREMQDKLFPEPPYKFTLLGKLTLFPIITIGSYFLLLCIIPFVPVLYLLSILYEYNFGNKFDKFNHKTKDFIRRLFWKYN